MIISTRPTWRIGVLLGCLLMAAAMLGLGPAAVWAQRAPAVVTVDQEKVGTAIEKGVTWLLRQQKPDGSFTSRDVDNAHIALALLECRVSLKNAGLQRLLSYLAAQRSSDAYFAPLRAEVMALAASAGGAAGRKAFEAQIATDYKATLGNQDPAGLWSHRFSRTPYIELSSTAIHSLISCGIEGFRSTESTNALLSGMVGLLKVQNDNGGWAYGATEKNSSPSDRDSTLQALSCLIAYGRDQSDSQEAARFNELLSTAIGAGIKNIGDSYRDEARGPNERDSWFYRRSYFFGRLLRYMPLESLGNTKFAADWINPVMARQQEDGSWRGPVETGHVLYLLAQIRAKPVIAEITDTTKPPLANRTLVNLTQQMSRWLPVSVSYTRSRLVEIDRYRKLPMILIDVTDTWKLVEEEKKLLREYVSGGGTIILNAPLQGRDAAANLAAKLSDVWPGTKLEPINRNDAMWTAREPQPDKPVCHGLNDGVRTFLFAVGRDNLAEFSVGRLGSRGSYQSMLNNIAVYASENRLEFSGPLNSDIPREATPAPALAAQKVIAIGVVTGKASLFEKQGLPAVPYNGFAAAAGLIPKQAKLELLGPKPLNAAHENLSLCDLAYLPVVGGAEFDDEEIAGLKKYVEGGGFLFIETRLGDVAADRAAKKVIDLLGLKNEAVREHEILVGTMPAGAAGFNIARTGQRRDGKLQPVKETDLRILKIDERVVGVYSPLDIIVSASGIPCFGLRGYATDDAQRLLANLLIYRTAR